MKEAPQKQDVPTALWRDDELTTTMPSRHDVARALRKQPTDAHQRVWELVRAHRFHGLKFRRQHVVAGVVVDLFISGLQVAVELEGSGDAHKTRTLTSHGVTVLHLKTDDISRAGLETLLRPFL
ncbi:MAG TPA: DUF559 domain-containing protein, partial [Myxococcota bacterium]